jgi:hypothetical protein
MLIWRLRPLHVLLHARRVTDIELLGQELHHRPRHIQRILKEAAHRPHRAQLHREPKAMMIRPATRDQVPISVIEVEEALDLSRRQLAGEPAVRTNLLIGQELHRHESRP